MGSRLWVNPKRQHVFGVAVVAAVITMYILYRSRQHPMEGLTSLDPRLVQHVRDKLLQPPSKLPYNLDEPSVADPSVGQSRLVLEILNKTEGTFVECGALDGETRSNTLFMERKLGWRGLLIEADPQNYRKMIDKHRKAWTINACLSGNMAEVVSFRQDFNQGAIEGDGTDTENTPKYKSSNYAHADVLCVPLETMLDALGWGTVDYFSLDVEGHEYAVLSQLPFDRLNIKTLSVEFRHVPEGKEGIRKLMEAHGYVVYDEITHWNDLANDFIFKKRGL